VIHRYIRGLGHLLSTIFTQPLTFGRLLVNTAYQAKSRQFTCRYPAVKPPEKPIQRKGGNPFWDYFEANREGPGIWKWEHYFEIYQQYFNCFAGRKVNLLEVGIYSGGSLGMWRSCLGQGCHVYGADIEPACKVYANEYTTIAIGDQADPAFWRDFLDQHPPMDIVIDDGGHTYEQQRATLEALLPSLNPGGVYVCEDIHRNFNRFGAYATHLVDQLNTMWAMTDFQKAVPSIHFYPYCMVIVKHEQPVADLNLLRRGNQWQPFFDDAGIPMPSKEH